MRHRLHFFRQRWLQALLASSALFCATPALAQSNIVGGSVSINGVAVTPGPQVSPWDTGVGSSTTLYVGYTADGTLAISGGGSVLSYVGLLGYAAGSTGTVTVDGPGSEWHAVALQIGYNSTGRMEITNGGVVTLDNVAYVGFGGGAGSLIVDGPGSQLNSVNYVTVGNSTGSGTLQITNGGVVSSGGGYNAVNTGSTSSVTINGPGSQWNSTSFIYVATHGIATVTLSDGGSLSAQTFVAVANAADGNGTLNIGAAAGAAAAAPGTVTTPTLMFQAGTAHLVFNHTDTSGNYEFTPVITGGSATTSAVDVYSGTTVMTGVGSDYFGPTTIRGGTLAAGAANVFSPNSDYVVQAGGTLDLRGNDQTVPSLTNAGLVNMGTGTAPGTVLTTTNYVGQGGTIAMNTFLGADNSPSDRLVIDGGTATGNSFLRFTNAGGPGAMTTANGILVIDAINGATTAGAFTMANGELRAGAFDYRLFQGGLNGSDPDNWYLRSTMIPPVPPVPPVPPSPIIGPELATYGVVQPIAQQLGRSMLGTHDERFGDLYAARPSCEPAETNASPYTKAPVYTKAPTDCAYGWRPAVWGRLFGQQIDNHYQAFADPRASGQVAGMQVGFDVLRSDSLIAGHTDYAGLYFAYGNANVDASGLVTNAAATANVLQHTGHFNLNAYSGGAYWTHYGPQGGYLDLVLQGTSYGGAASTEFARLNTNGSGFISSIEGGYPIPLPQLGFGFVLEPQAQVLWQWVSFDSGNDGLGPVALGTTSATTARVGLKGKWTITTDSGQVWQPYVRTNYWSDFGGTSATLFGPDSIPLISHAQYMDVTAGFTTRIDTHYSAFADAGYQFAVSHDGGGKRDGVKGTAGLRYQW